MKDYIFTYITTNIVNGKQYIGMHITNDYNDGYLGSGKALKKALSKYGNDNFTREIINFYHDEFSAHSDEEKFIQEYNTISPNGYNISPTGGSHSGGKLSEETKQKISRLAIGRTPSEESKIKNRLAHLGRINGPHSEETRRKISIANTGKKKEYRPHSAEHSRKIGESNRGKIISQEQRQQISKKLKGNNPSKETRQKLSIVATEQWRKWRLNKLKNEGILPSDGGALLAEFID